MFEWKNLPDVDTVPGSTLVGVLGQATSIIMTKDTSSMNVEETKWWRALRVYIPTVVKIGDGKSDAAGWVWWDYIQHHGRSKKVDVTENVCDIDKFMIPRFLEKTYS